MQILTKLTAARSWIAGALAASAALTASVQFWLQSDSPSISQHILRYVATGFSVELMLVSIVALVIALPTKWRALIPRLYRRILHFQTDQIRAYKDPKFTRIAFFNLLPFLLVGGALIYLSLQIIRPVAIGMIKRSVVMVKYSRTDFLRYLYREGDRALNKMDYDLASEYYRAIVTLFGDIELTKSAQRQIVAIAKLKKYGAKSFLRASEIERSSGPNRRSYYLYLSSLPFMPASSELYLIISRYEQVFQSADLLEDKLSGICANVKSSVPALQKLDFEKTVLGLATSNYSRETLQKVIDSNYTIAEADTMVLCSDRARFGPTVYPLKSDRIEAAAIVPKIRQIAGVGQ